jgi:uncharacterized protein (TIGR02453 family)
MFEKTYSFLRLIKQNNNREWYHANKNIYNEAKSEFEHITEILLHEVTGFDKSLLGLTPKDCIFRIFRDVRFSIDKSPYKTNFGTFLAPGGRKAGNAGYYLHIEPGESFIAGGIHMPPSPVLRAIREDIFEHVEEFKEIVSTAKKKSDLDGFFGEKLSGAPRGFPKDFPDIELLKYKSYGLSKSLSDKEMMAEVSIQNIVSDFKNLHPLLQFINEAIKNAN